MRFEQAYARTPLAEILDLETFRSRCPSSHLVRRSEGQSVFEEGHAAEAFFFVVEGRVKLVKQRQPRDSILGLATLGESVCESVPLGGGSYCCDALADAPTTRLLVIHRSEALALMSLEPAVSGVFIGMLSARTRMMCGRVMDLTHGDSLQRVARELERLGHRFGEPRGEVIHVPLSISRRDLAELTGMAVETAIRAVRRLERAGLVRKVPGGFELLDTEALRAVADGTTSCDRCG